MHSLQIFITKKEDRDDVRDKIEEFLLEYQNTHWDWYEFGGRWSNIFDGETTVPLKSAMSKIEEMINDKEKQIVKLKKTCSEILNGTTEEKKFMWGYKLKKLGELMSDDYMSDPIVYNLEDYSAWAVPKNLDDYDVTIVDIHS